MCSLEKRDDIEAEPAGLDMVGSQTATSSRGQGDSRWIPWDLAGNHWAGVAEGFLCWVMLGSRP